MGGQSPLTPNKVVRVSCISRYVINSSVYVGKNIKRVLVPTHHNDGNANALNITGFPKIPNQFSRLPPSLGDVGSWNKGCSSIEDRAPLEVLHHNTQALVWNRPKNTFVDNFSRLLARH